MIGLTKIDLTDHDRAFLEELDSEIGWEWKWEKRHRMWGWGINWATWVARLLLLALTWYQLTGHEKGRDELWGVFTLAFLSVEHCSSTPFLHFSFSAETGSTRR